MGVFRRRWDYAPSRRKLPTLTPAPAPDVSFTGAPRTHPNRRVSLRDGTFRGVLWQYFQLRRAKPGVVPSFGPLSPDCDGTIDATITHDVDQTPPFYTHINEDPASPGADWIANDLTESDGSAFICIPDLPADFESIVSLTIEYSRQAVGFSNDSCTLFAQIFDSDELTTYTDEIVLADETDTTQLTETRVFTINATGLAASRDDWNAGFIRFRWDYTQTGGPDNAQIRLFAAELNGTYARAVADILGIKVSRVYPSRAVARRDKTFRTPWLDHYQPKRVLPPAIFVPGILVAISKIHPGHNIRLRDRTFRPSWKQYYQPKRVLLPSVFVPGITNAPQKVHPQQNLRLRDSTFRPPWLEHYQPKRVLYPSRFVPGITNAVQLVHPSKNPGLRDSTFRPSFKDYYQPRRVLPPSQFVPGITQVVSKVHSSRNASLRNKTFRPSWKQYYQPKRVLPPSQFVPGILPVKHPRLRNVWDRKSKYYHYRVKRALSTQVAVAPSNVSTVLVSKIHPSRNISLRDGTFRKRKYRKLDRKLPASIFVPGTLVVIPRVHPSRNIILRDETFRLPPREHYQPKHVLPPARFIAGILVVISKVHPQRNLQLRDSTFRPPFRDYYQSRRVLPPSQFVPGALSAKHPRKSLTWSRKTEYRYYRVKRTLPPGVVVPDVSTTLVSKVHPSQNISLRDSTFRLALDYRYQPRRVFFTAIFIPGVLIAISRVHPSRDRRLRDETFRLPFRSYYRPRYLFLNAPISGIPDAMFKRMYKSMFKRMEPH